MPRKEAYGTQGKVGPWTPLRMCFIEVSSEDSPLIRQATELDLMRMQAVNLRHRGFQPGVSNQSRQIWMKLDEENEQIEVSCCVKHNLQLLPKATGSRCSPVARLAGGSSASASAARSGRVRVSSVAASAARNSRKKGALVSRIRSFSAMVIRPSCGKLGSGCSSSAHGLAYVIPRQHQSITLVGSAETVPVLQGGWPFIIICRH